MRISGEGKLLRIFLGEADRAGNWPLYSALVRKAREVGLAGATAWHGVEGFGAGSRIHTASVLRLSEDLPIVVEIVDSEEKIRAALPEFEKLIEESGGGALITLEKVDVIRYKPGQG